MIGARLMKCHDKDYCMPDEQIESFLTEKYLLLVNNQIRFDSEKLDEESIVAEATTRWFMIDKTHLQTIWLEIIKTRLRLQDFLISFDDLTELEADHLFKLNIINTP